jgi:hypothetical protein
MINPYKAHAMAQVALAKWLGLDPSTAITPEKIAPIVGTDGTRYRILLHGEGPPQTIAEGDCDVIILAEVKGPLTVSFYKWIPAEQCLMRPEETDED